MKKYLLLLVGISMLSVHPVRAGDDGGALPRFDLDFAGGTPAELVKAIETATGKHLNAIIDDNFTNWTQRAFSVRNVTVAQVFDALAAMNKDTRRTTDGHLQMWTSGFRTEGAPNENSIWYYFDDNAGTADKPNVCRFYELSPYLAAGYKVEDITTAITAAWEMLGASAETAADSMKYHKDTKMLIVKGDTDDMKMIDDMLAQLAKGNARHAAEAEKSKTP